MTCAVCTRTDKHNIQILKKYSQVSEIEKRIVEAADILLDKQILLKARAYLFKTKNIVC